MSTPLSKCNNTVQFNNATHDMNSICQVSSTSCPVSNPAYSYTNNKCVCASGYAGSIILLSSGSSTGCNICPVGTYSTGGTTTCTSCPAGTWTTTTGNTSSVSCYPIPCNTQGYIGNAGSCTCDTSNGYIGVVNYNNGVIGGCTQIPCTATGYSGNPGKCVCAPNYTGTVAYNSKGLTGCSPIPCTSPGYTGTAGSCVCATGYIGTVSYVFNSLSGCKQPPKITFYDSYPPKSTGKSITFNIDPNNSNYYYMLSTSNGYDPKYYSDVTKSCWYGKQNLILFTPQSLSFSGCRPSNNPGAVMYATTNVTYADDSPIPIPDCTPNGVAHMQLDPDSSNIYPIQSGMQLFKTDDHPEGHYPYQNYYQIYFQFDPNMLNFS
jgi:hypothetical protein